MYSVTLKAGLVDVVLPDGNRYQGGQVASLTDDQYLSMPTSAQGAVLSSTVYVPGAGSGNVWTPADHGYTAWTLDPAATSASGTTLSAGYVYMSQIVLRRAATLSKLHLYVGTAGVTLTANQCLAGLYNASGTRVGITGDMSTTWNSTGPKPMSLLTPYSAAAGKYYIALLFNGTTSPIIACGSTQGATFTPGNSGLAAGSYRFCRSASGQTSLPASAVLSGYTPDANNLWVAVN